MTPSLMGNGGVAGSQTATSSSPISSSSSTTPNSSQMIGGECTSPSFINGHEENPLNMISNGY
jgi:hypothetical protein